MPEWTCASMARMDRYVIWDSMKLTLEYSVGINLEVELELVGIDDVSNAGYSSCISFSTVTQLQRH